MEKFTKGEWRYEWESSCVIDGDNEIVCDTYSDGGDELESNGHLIAAAPEMYAMLKQVLSSPYCVDATGLPTHEDVKKLLAKARGEK